MIDHEHDLGLVEPVDGLGQRVVVAVADAALRRSARPRPGQRIDPLGMNVVLVQIVDERANILELPAKPPLRLLHDAPKAENPRCGGITSDNLNI
jgi:hypothetical protein